ncbi:MAG: cell division protein SepF [Coriobacteriales bacterium]|jgi:FtsZ-interacting cell division protein YlmF
MGIFGSVKNKLGLGKNDYDEDYDDFDDDYGDDYDEDYDDDYDDDYDNGGRESDDDADNTSSYSSGTASWPESLDGTARRDSRLESYTPLVSSADVRSTRRPIQRSTSEPDYESSLQMYKIEPRDSIGRASNHSQESLEAAREELDQLQKGIPVPLNSMQNRNVSGTVSRRIVTVIPNSYNDVEKVSEAFKSGSSAVISFVNVPSELAKRMLDFCFGVVSVSGGNVEKIGNKVFFLSRGGVALTEGEKQQLRDSGVL